MLYSPEIGADLNVNHVIDLANHQVSLTAMVSHRSEQQTNFLLLEDTESDSYTTLNLDATLYSGDEDWSVSAFVRNATDERFSVNTNVSNRGLAYAIFSPPRTFGVRFMANF